MQCAVKAIISSNVWRTFFGKRCSSPIAFKRTLLFNKVSRSPTKNFSNNFIKAAISALGRDQFSLENAYKVRCSMPHSAAASTISRTASTPDSWPRMRNKPPRRAQRPLPSMMTATCLGIAKSCFNCGSRRQRNRSHQRTIVRGQGLPKFDQSRRLNLVRGSASNLERFAASLQNSELQ